MEMIKLNNNLECPVVGIGTFMLSPAEAENSVREADILLWIRQVDGEKKIKRSILECGNIGVETEAQDIQFNIPELFVE